MTKATGINCIIALLLFGTLLHAEVPNSASGAADTMTSSTVPDAGFAPGDTLDVSLYDFPETRAAITVAIDSRGYIRLPYAGSVHIAGMSPGQAEQAIENALVAKGIEKQASVSIKVLMSSSLIVYLTGEVTHPAALPLFAPAPLAYVLNQGGGFTGVEGKHISILHRNSSLPTEISFDSENMTAKAMNTMVYPGDIIDVLPTGMFYVVGEVTRPGLFPLTGGLTVGNGIAGLGSL